MSLRPERPRARTVARALAVDALFPPTAGNAYRGSRIALAAFAVLTLVTLIRSAIHLFAPDGGAQSIATIPLDAYGDAAAATVTHVFGLWGLSQLLVGLVYVVVLWRYRSLVPLMFLLMVLEYAIRLGLAFAKPLETVGTAPGAVGNWLMVPIAVVLLLLSLRSGDEGRGARG